MTSVSPKEETTATENSIPIQAEEVLIKNGRPVSKLDATNVLRSAFSLGERLQGGRTILKLTNVVTPEELETLVKASFAAAEQRKGRMEGEGKVCVRLLTVAAAERDNAPDDALPEEISNLVETILVRVMTFLEDADTICPSLKQTLFGDDTTPSIAQLFRDNQLLYSSREPAINVYEAPDGCFAMHKDHHALSIVIPLSCPKKHFTGGGTAFWSQSHPVQGMDRPSLILKPTPGTALLWGGRVSHQGMPITSGRRVVLVASFSGPQGGVGEDVRDRLAAGFGLKTVLSGR